MFLSQAEADEQPGLRAKGAGLPGLHHHHRGEAAGRPQHGPCRLCPGPPVLIKT